MFLPCCWIVFKLILLHEALHICFESFRINKVCSSSWCRCYDPPYPTSFCSSWMVLLYLLRYTSHHWVITTFHHGWPNKASAGCDRSRERGKRGAFDFLTAAERREWGMHQLQTMALYPHQWLTHRNTHTHTDTHTHTHTLTKHRHIHARIRTSTQTDTHSRKL